MVVRHPSDGKDCPFVWVRQKAPPMNGRSQQTKPAFYVFNLEIDCGQEEWDRVENPTQYFAHLLYRGFAT